MNQWALQFYNRVAYHDYEGIALDLDERERLVADLGQQNAMILRNHGLLTVGATVAEAFILMLNLDRACRVQLAIQSTGQATYPVSAQVSEKTARQYASGDTNRLPGSPDPSEREWRALLAGGTSAARPRLADALDGARLNGARRFFPAAPAPSPGEPHEPTRLSDLERRHGGWLSGATALPAAARNGVLNIAVQPEPPGLMLGIVQNGPTQMIGGQIYESLLRYDDKLEPMPGLAASWTVNDAPPSTPSRSSRACNGTTASPSTRTTWCSASTSSCARPTRACAPGWPSWTASRRWTSTRSNSACPGRSARSWGCSRSAPCRWCRAISTKAPTT